DVVGQDRQAGFGGDVLQSARSEVCRAPPSLDGAEDVLDRAAADRHGFGHRLKSALHGIEHRLVLPSSDTLLLAGRAQRTGCTGTTSLLVEVHADELATFHPGKALLKLLASRAAVGISLGLMDE